jgi:hypothetical protein
MAVLGVMAHFTSSSDIQMNPVIGLCLLEGAHTGANMAEVVTDVLATYDVEDHLGYVVCDNASNNDTLLRSLEELQGINNRDYDSKQHRIRCVGHVINLAVKAFWFGDVDRTLLQDTIVVTQDTMAVWRRMGPWGKAHNITIYALASPQRRQELKNLGGHTVLQRDNATRWNSGFTMIQSLLRIRDAVDVFCARHIELEQDPLRPDEWDQLADAIDILEPFQSSTLRLEGDDSELFNVLPELDFLRTAFTSVLQRYQRNPHLHIRRAAAEGVIVLDKYREKFKELTVCVAAVVLHPAYKWDYFTVAVASGEWRDEELANAKDRVQGLWINEYKVPSSRPESQEEQHQDAVLPKTPFATWRAQRQREVIGILNSHSIFDLILIISQWMSMIGTFQ